MPDWKSRHPFTSGQLVWAKPWGPCAQVTASGGRSVYMRGESDLGLWIAFEGVPYEFSVHDFTAVAPMPPAHEAAGAADQTAEAV